MARVLYCRQRVRRMSLFWTSEEREKGEGAGGTSDGKTLTDEVDARAASSAV